MASGYAPIESDERGDEEDGLEFKNFPPETTTSRAGQGAGNVDRGYLDDQQARSKSGFWTFEYYQQYFDVETTTVLKRCVTTLIPTSAPTYVATQLSPSPDLYGPFWTLTTVIFALFVFSSLALSIVSFLSTGDGEYNYNFQLLSIAVSLVYAYGIGVPALLWGGLRYLGVEWSLIEAIAVWGYGQFVWIPVAALCIVPIPIFRWTLVGLSALLSGYFLIANVNPVLASSSTDAKAARILVPALIGVLHLALALTFKVLFFSYYIVKEIGSDDPLSDVSP